MIEPNLLLWFSRKLKENQFHEFNSDMLAKLTVVIPSYERHEYLLRAIVFWSNSPARVIILDGSSKPFSDDIQSMIKSLSNIQYIHKTESYALRMSETVKHLATDYVVTMGDDEFHLKTGLEAALSVLLRNPDVVGCIGQSVSYRSDENGLNYGKGYPHENYRVVHESAVDRLCYAMAEYNAATCYAVLNRSCWIRSYGTLRDWSSPYASEIQQALITYICGKLVSVKSLYWLRSFDVPPVHGVQFNRKLYFYDWWSDAKFDDERKKFVGLIVSELLSKDCNSSHEAKAIVDSAIESYLDFCKKQSYGNFTNTIRASQYLKALLRKFIPENMIDQIKRIVGRGVMAVHPMDFDFGDLNNFAKTEYQGSYGLNDRMLYEMKLVEVLIVEFNEQISSYKSLL
jgi:glycosyltransferase domain-containing protein